MCIITISMHCLCFVYWINTPLLVSDVSTAHHQEVECVYGEFHPSLLTVNLEVPFAIYTHCLPMMGFDTPETCRGVLIQQTKNKQCIELVILYTEGVCLPIPVAARSMVWVYGCSFPENAGWNSAGTWISYCCECCVLSGRGLYDRPVTHAEESNRLWCVSMWYRNHDNKEV
jgi:hypothetical protein